MTEKKKRLLNNIAWVLMGAGISAAVQIAVARRK